MAKVVNLAAFRDRRAREGTGVKARPPDDPDDNQIQLTRQPDGSYRARITGVYADDSAIAIEAMVDAVKHLAAANPLAAIKHMASAIKQLSVTAKRADEP
ncbi:hypothetical protein LJR296_001416 [Cupriavidus necator]|uniref:hypothetical protein n=1 Tax=Cupriavidus necator TaxID=106590 RepID=UPI003ED027D0